MNQYIWYHPSYIADKAAEGKNHIVSGQMQQAKKSGYILLSDDQLSKVTAEDHLTIVGHSYRSEHTSKTNEEDEEDSDHDDTGLYMQGETAQTTLNRLKKNGLTVSPKILSLECCSAAIGGGLAEQLSGLAFFKDTLIEANISGVGRSWHDKCCVSLDKYGRMIDPLESSWHFYLDGKQVHKAEHGKYDVLSVLIQVRPLPSREALRTVYDNYVGGFSLAKFSIFRESNDATRIIKTLINRANTGHHDPQTASEATLQHFEKQGYQLRS